MIDRESAWREALERRNGRPWRDRYRALKAGIYAAIGELAFPVDELITRAETNEALAACLDAHHARNGEALGKILGGISRDVPVGEFCVLYIKREKGLALWSVVRVIEKGVDEPSTPLTALPTVELGRVIGQ